MATNICHLFMLYILLTGVYAEIDFFEKGDESPIEMRIRNSGISEISKEAMLSGTADVFHQMSEQDLAKLSPDIIADYKTESIQQLSTPQIRIITKNFFGANKLHLSKVFKAFNQGQLMDVVDSMKNVNKNSSEQQHLNCFQYEALIEAFQQTFGEAKDWDKTMYDKLGSDFIQCLPPKILKSVAKNKNAFRTLLKNTRNVVKKHKSVYDIDKKSLVRSAKDSFGEMRQWMAEDLESAAPILAVINPKEIKNIQPNALKEALGTLGQSSWDEKRGQGFIKVLKESSGFGNISSWTPQDIESLGNLRKSLSVRELSQISDETFKKSVAKFGKTTFSPHKRIMLGKRLKTLYGNTKNWTKDHISNASNLLAGMPLSDLQDMDDDALIEALPSVKDSMLPPIKARILAKKIQKKMGAVDKWNITTIHKIGGLLKDLPVKILKKLPAAEANEAIKMLRKRSDISIAKKSALVRQALANTSISIGDLGEFVTEYPYSKLKDLRNIDDVLSTSITDSSSSNGGDDESETAVAPKWKASQAMAILSQLLTDASAWGPVSPTSIHWNVANVKKLGRLALGLSKTQLTQLTVFSYPDFAAEFATISNWTNGQAKMIATGFMKSFEGRESEITVTDLMTLRDLAVNIGHDLIKKLSEETKKDAIRIIGGSRLLKQLPSALKRKKTELALEIMDKPISSLTSEDLDDMGNLLSYLTPEEIREIDGDSFNGAIVRIGELEDLDNNRTDAMLAKALDVYNGAQNLDEQKLVDMGKLVEALDVDHIAAIPHQALEESLDVFAQAMMRPDTASAVVNAFESERKRRSTDKSMMSGDELIEMGSLLFSFDYGDISDVSDEAFLSVLDELSVIPWNYYQLSWWTMKLTGIWGRNTTTYSDEQLLQLNEFAKGLNGDQLKDMPLTSNEVIESFGVIRGYWEYQIIELCENVKQRQAMSDVTAEDLKAWGVITLGLTTDDISQISDEAYSNAAGSLGEMQGWSLSQMQSLRDKAVSAFGEVDQWQLSQVAMAGAAIGGFTAEDIQSLNGDAIDVIQGSVLKVIPAAIFKEFTVDQLSELSAEQATYITDEQMTELSEEQKDVLFQLQTNTMGITQAKDAACYTVNWNKSLFFVAIFITLFYH